MLRLTRRLEWIAILAVLLLAAAVRLYQLARLPAGFNDSEIDTLRILESIAGGHISVFYNLRALPEPGHAVLFPLIETVMTSIFGNGLWSYRIISALAGLLGVAFTYSAARRLTGFWAALIAALCMAVGLWPVILSRLAIGQTLLVPAFAATLWLVACSIHLWQDKVVKQPPSTITYFALALTLTIALYSHETGFFALLIPIGFTIYLFRQRQWLNIRTVSYGIFSIVITLTLCLPWLATTLRLPEVSGVGAYWVDRPASIGDFFSRLLTVIESAVSGASPASLLLTLPVLALFGIGLVESWRQRRAPANVLILLALAAGLIPAIWFGRGAFDLAAAFPPVAIVIGVGSVSAVGWIGRRLADRPWFAQAPNVAMAGLFGVLTAGAIVGLSAGLQTEFFVRWSVDSALAAPYHTALGHLADYLNTITGTIPTVICTQHLISTPDYPLPDSILLQRMTHRPTINWRFADCDHVAILANAGNTERIIFSDPAAHDPLTGPPVVPAALRQWITPDTLIEPIGGAPTMFNVTLTAYQPLAAQIGQVIYSKAFWPPDQQTSTDSILLPVQMGDYLHFEGYTLDAARTYKPGEFIHLITYWRIDGAQPPDVRFFAHVLVDPGSPPAIQNDVLDVLPTYLQDRDIVIQDQTIQIPYPFVVGMYYVSVGAYHASQEGQPRIPIYDDSGQIHSDRLFLGTINIKP